MEHINCLCCFMFGLLFIVTVIHFSCISFSNLINFFLFLFVFFLFLVMLYYSYTQTFSLSLLYCCYSYCASFCALLDGVCLSRNKMITYLLTYFRSSKNWGRIPVFMGAHSGLHRHLCSCKGCVLKTILRRTERAEMEFKKLY